MPYGLGNVPCKFKFRWFSYGNILENIISLGTDDQGFGFGGTGKKSNAGKFDDYGESFTLNDVIGCYLDLEVGRIHWAKNGKEFPSAYSLRGEFVKVGLFPAVVIKV